MKRDWTQARRKVDLEVCCRVCGSVQRVEACHVVGRKHDKDGFVNPDSIVPLCGPATTSSTCHGRYDSGWLDLAPFLTAEEGAQAVLDAGSLWLAVRRVSGRQAA